MDPSILLIDDDQKLLRELRAELSRLLPDVEIDTWRPAARDDDVLQVLEDRVSDRTVLVATDQDLTGRGMKGLFGSTIVRWCQQRAVPVGDFSRAPRTRLPAEPNLYELRISHRKREGARFIARAFHGFLETRRRLLAVPDSFESLQSLASVLAAVLRRPELDADLALYMTRLGTANSAIMEHLKKFGGKGDHHAEKVRILTYVLGHVLLNAILRFPGPVLSELALCAYVGTSKAEGRALRKLFRGAAYEGPFRYHHRFFWRSDVDGLIVNFAAGSALEDFDSIGDYNRAMVERKLGRRLARHECGRCDGLKGGFLCPLTDRTVCHDAECSVSASSWIPQGAYLCRVEWDFFEEWAPILGL